MVRLKGLFLFLVILMVFSVPAEGANYRGVRIWDTGSLLGKEIDVGEREDWEIITSPTTNYSFQGDVALENERILILFSSEKGSVLLHSKESKKEKPIKIIPLDLEGARASSIRSSKILKNSEDEVTLEVSFLASGNRIMRQAFSLGREKRFVEIRPLENAGAVQVHTQTRFTIIPAFAEHDLVFDPRDYSASHLLLPSENIILNLIDGEERIVIITWPFGEQRVNALLKGKGEGRFIKAIEVTFDKQSVYVGILEAAGIWHEVRLDDFLYLKDVALDWRRPFPAGWKANFYAERRSMFIKFRATRSSMWQPEEGWFVWPCWFEGEKAMFRLNKKVLKYRDIALIYPLGRDKATPAGVDTPSDILRQTLGDELWNSIRARGKQIPMQVEPWPGERPHIIGACAAVVALRRLFERGLAAEQAFLVELVVNGVISSVDSDLRRIEGYRRSTRKIKEFINAVKGDNPALTSFLEKMEKIIRELEKERYEIRFLPWLRLIGKEDAGWKESRALKIEYTIIEVGERIKRLAREDPENLPESRVLRSKLGYWTVHEPIYRRHLRRLQQEAIIVAAESGEPEVMRAAEEIRRLAMEARRNPGHGF